MYAWSNEPNTISETVEETAKYIARHTAETFEKTVYATIRKQLHQLRHDARNDQDLIERLGKKNAEALADTIYEYVTKTEMNATGSQQAVDLNGYRLDRFINACDARGIHIDIDVSDTGAIRWENTVTTIVVRVKQATYTGRVTQEPFDDARYARVWTTGTNYPANLYQEHIDRGHRLALMNLLREVTIEPQPKDKRMDDTLVELLRQKRDEYADDNNPYHFAETIRKALDEKDVKGTLSFTRIAGEDGLMDVSVELVLWKNGYYDARRVMQKK